MKKLGFITAILITLLTACDEPNINNNENPNDPNKKATIVFDNTKGICAVTVYSSYLRNEESKIARIPAGMLSQEFDYYPGSSVPFFLSYQINFKGISGFTVDFVPPEIGKDQIYVRIDPNIKTTITIPTLAETLSSPEALLSSKSYLLIQNNSSYSLQLLRGNSILPPDNMSETLVNSGERALYTINPGAASPYQLMVGGSNISFPGSLVSFEAGRVYSFIFDGGVNLVSEIEMKLENVAGVSPNNPVPEAPVAPVITASDGLLTVHWTAVEGAEKYEVYISTTQNPLTLPERTVFSTTTVLTGLINKTVYYVWVKAVNENGSSDFSPRAQGIPWPDGEVPAVPEMPVIIPAVNQLTVHWEETGGAASYEVYVNTIPSTPSSAAIETDKTSAVIANLENNVIYYIWVLAVNGTGKSGYSPPVSGTPQIPTIAPVAPPRPALSAGSRELSVTWQAVRLAESYEVWYGTSGNSAQAVKFGGDISGTEIVITNLTNEQTYYVWIKAKNVAGTSGFSLSANAKPSAFAVLPETPDVPTVTPGSRELAVSWPAAEGALSYEVWTGVTNNAADAAKRGADVFDTSVTLNNLANDTTYYIWVMAKNSVGTSGLSPMASGTPSAFAAPPPAPQSAPTISAGSGQLAVSWQEAEGALSYEVWMATTSNPTVATKSGDVSELSAVVAGLTNNTTYYVWINAKNSRGTSDFSPMASGTPSAFTVVPGSPATPAVSIGNGQITVTWTAVDGTTAYEIWLGTANTSASAAKNGADESASLSRTISGLTNGTTYYVWIKAKNNIGASGFSPVTSGKPVANAAPPTLTAANGQLSVTWAAIAGADQYEVFYGTGINPPQTPSQTITATTAAITGLVNGTSYNVWVRGRNSTGTGAMSAAASARPVGNMGAVTVISGNGQLSLSWSAVAGADQYEAYCDTTNAIPASPARTVNAPATTATITGLTNGTVYYVFVIPKNANGAGGASASASGVPLATPGALTVSAANQRLTVSWAAVPGAASYEVYQSTTATIPVSPAATVTNNEREFTGLSNGTTYYFWVKAVNANGTSGASPAASGKPIGNMGAVTVTSGNGQLMASWSTVAGADQYEVYHSTTNSIPASPALTVTGTTATMSSLTNGTIYYVWVKGRNTTGAGNASTVVYAKPLGASGTPTVNSGLKQLQVTWTAVSGADEYEVYYGTGATPTTLATTTIGTTATITGLTNGTTYYVRLRAKNANGISGYGTSASNMPGIPGLYRGNEWVGNHNLSVSVSYISANAITGDNFYIIIGADETVSSMTLNYSGKTVGITLMGYGGERKITSSSFTINTGVTLTLDENITFNRSIVNLNSGELIINDGAKISGYTSTSDGHVINIGNGGTVTMNGGTISDNSATFWSGSIVIQSGGTFIMNGGTISENTGSTGGGICMEGGTFIMNGGIIKENSVGDSSYCGGGIYVKNGTFTMNDGTISGNSSDSYYGGGIHVDENGTFIMHGGTISGNTANQSGGGIYVDNNGTFTMHGGTISGNTANWNGGGIYTRLGGIITIYDGTISGNTANSNGGGIAVGDGATFTMHGGIINENISVGTSSSYDGGGGVYVSYGTFNMNSGTISGNTANQSGGGICVGPSGTFNINGGLISVNTASNDGGGISFRGTAITMNDGIISRNIAGRNGGGIYIWNPSSITINGGLISGNTSNYDGGGIYCDSNTSSITMTGMTISGNTSNNNGGGICFSDKANTFTMNSGIISGNTATNYGGGIYAYGKVTMNGGIISGNTARIGGGVYVYSNSTSNFFKKLPSSGGENSGIIYGSEAVGTDANGVPLRNIASDGDAYGHAVYKSYQYRWRNTTAGQTDQIEADTFTSRGLSADGNPPYVE